MKSKNIILIIIPFMFICSISYSQDSAYTGPMYEWNIAGSHPQNYEIGKDENILYKESPAYYLKSVKEADKGFGTIMKYIQPGEQLSGMLGKRIKLTGVVKSEHITNHAGMWMRVDGPDPEKSLQFDNMHNRPLKGTKDWTKYEIVLDVPDSSKGIAYGVLISGSGQVWLGSFSFEVVGDDVPSTNLEK